MGRQGWPELKQHRPSIVLGTRPEIIKLGPIVSAMGGDVDIIHTGQHYDPEMAGVFFEAFGISDFAAELKVGGESRGQQIGRVVAGLDDYFDQIGNPSAVIVQGDTNTALAGALTANAREIPLVHVEAGLRSFDRAMPEEHNRVLADHLSDLCLAPTEVSQNNLLNESISDARIVITGNTIVDAVRELTRSSDQMAAIRRRLIEDETYVVATFHRPENVDSPKNLQRILEELGRISVPVVLPLHPRTRAVATRNKIDLSQGQVRAIDPLGYLDFLSLVEGSSLVVADSGGLQEEVSVLKKPMIVVRNSTERPEVLDTFCSLLSVTDPIAETAERRLIGDPYSLDDLARMPSPYGTGDAALRSVEAIGALLSS